MKMNDNNFCTAFGMREKRDVNKKLVRRLILPATLCCILCILSVVVFAGCKTADSVIETTPPQKLWFSFDSGVYEQDSITVTVKAPEGYTVAFTTDGTFPTVTDNSCCNTISVELNKGMARYLAGNGDLQVMRVFNQMSILDDHDLPNGAMLCAAMVDAEGNISKPEVNIYYLGMDFGKIFPECLVLSVVIDPASLLDYHTGILATGAFHDEWIETEDAQKAIADGFIWLAEANFTQSGRSWERECIIQLYDGEDRPVIEQAAGIRTQGGYSRRLTQKSFNFYFRNDYGSNHLVYDLFPGINEVKSFTLRSGGNDAEALKYKDAMLQDLVSNRAVTTSCSRPAVLYLNGEYWGVYLLTEKVSAQMLHDRYGVDQDQVVVVKKEAIEVGKEDDLLLYKELMAFADKDLSVPENYRILCSVMNIQSFADYCAVRVYIGDADWGNTEWGNEKNMILWRTRDASYDGGRWQFMLYDLDNSCGLYSSRGTAFDTDHFRIALERVPLFSAAIHNQEFYSMFLDALTEIGEINFSYDRVSEEMQTYDQVIHHLMSDFYIRFGYPSWKYEVEKNNVLNFFEKRYENIIAYSKAYANGME